LLIFAHNLSTNFEIPVGPMHSKNVLSKATNKVKPPLYIGITIKQEIMLSQKKALLKKTNHLFEAK
jgi:hypothetical protein